VLKIYFVHLESCVSELLMFSLCLVIVSRIRRFFFYQIALTNVCLAILKVSATCPALNLGS
jgi:hypothetical protein